MEKIIAILKAIIAGLGGLFGWFLGDFNGFFYALIALMILDYVTGVAGAIVRKEVSSAVGFLGIFKKIMILVLVGVGNILDINIIGSGSVLRTSVIFFYAANEGISIIENASLIGLPIPAKLKDVLAQIKKKGDGGEE